MGGTRRGRRTFTIHIAEPWYHLHVLLRPFPPILLLLLLLLPPSSLFFFFLFSFFFYFLTLLFLGSMLVSSLADVWVRFPCLSSLYLHTRLSLLSCRRTRCQPCVGFRFEKQSSQLFPSVTLNSFFYHHKNPMSSFFKARWRSANTNQWSLEENVSDNAPLSYCHYSITCTNEEVGPFFLLLTAHCHRQGELSVEIKETYGNHFHRESLNYSQMQEARVGI